MRAIYKNRASLGFFMCGVWKYGLNLLKFDKMAGSHFERRRNGDGPPGEGQDVRNTSSMSAIVKTEQCSVFYVWCVVCGVWKYGLNLFRFDKMAGSHFERRRNDDGPQGEGQNVRNTHSVPAIV
jgi:hypothetical protein